jgi:hypothetical protein
MKTILNWLFFWALGFIACFGYPSCLGVCGTGLVLGLLLCVGESKHG